MSDAVRARIILLALVALLASAAVAPPLSKVPAGAVVVKGVNDADLFGHVLARVRAGEPYYDAMGAELYAMHYPTASVFNWRTPVLFELMAIAPPALILPSLLLLSIVALALTVMLLNPLKGTEAILLGVLMLVGALMNILAPANRLQTEGWCGVLILISILAYTRSAWHAAALAGVGALFVRELAAPYCLVCVLLAARDKRTTELALWLAGALAFGIFFRWHTQMVAVHIDRTAGLQMNSWVQFGGLRFLMLTLRESNSALLLAPRIISACAATLIAAALWSSMIPPHIKGVVVAYALFFVVVGQSFNDYWGLVVGPAYAVALAYAYGPSGFHTLVSRAVGRSHLAPNGVAP
jgi:hypothetical protein